jgi:hypothetical protein
VWVFHHEIELNAAAGVLEVSSLLSTIYLFFLVEWDLRHQVLRPLLAYCTAPNDR